MTEGAKDASEYGIFLLSISINGCSGLLLPSRVRRESDFGDHYSHVSDFLHERGLRHAASFFGNAPHRDIFLLHHDYGRQLCRKFKIDLLI